MTKKDWEMVELKNELNLKLYIIILYYNIMK